MASKKRRVVARPVVAAGAEVASSALRDGTDVARAVLLPQPMAASGAKPPDPTMPAVLFDAGPVTLSAGTNPLPPQLPQPKMAKRGKGRGATSSSPLLLLRPSEVVGNNLPPHSIAPDGVDAFSCRSLPSGIGEGLSQAVYAYDIVSPDFPTVDLQVSRTCAHCLAMRLDLLGPATPALLL